MQKKGMKKKKTSIVRLLTLRYWLPYTDKPPTIDLRSLVVFVRIENGSASQGWNSPTVFCGWFGWIPGRWGRQHWGSNPSCSSLSCRYSRTTETKFSLSSLILNRGDAIALTQSNTHSCIIGRTWSQILKACLAALEEVCGKPQDYRFGNLCFSIAQDMLDKPQ